MKTNFTRLLLFAALFFTTLHASAQAVGDYRSNVAAPPAVGQWTTPATWQTFDGLDWVTASAFPTSADGVITIQSGDSIQLTGASAAISIDQVVVESGGYLVIFNTSGTVTLNNGSGNDITVDGRLYISAGTTVAGTGNIVVNSGGLFTLRNSGVLSVPTTVNGQLHLGQASVSAGTVTGTTLTNNGTGTWIDGNFTLSTGASFVNTGTLTILSGVNVSWLNTGSNTISNSGSFIKPTTTTVTIAPAVTNTGTLSGFGTFNMTNVTTNTGTISPGSSPGLLTVSAASITGKAPNIAIEVTGTGNVSGTDNDQLTVPTAVDVTGSTLTVTNTGTAPAGTVYTIMNTTAGNITGPFAALNIPSNFSVNYNGNNITLTKIALFPLPVTWGEFKAVAQGNRVLLDWTTMMESNTSHFVIEHSTNSSIFTPVANIEAQGNSTYEARYKYTFNAPDLSRTNYFRIKQVDLDGKSTYSLTRSVKFDKGQVVAIQAYPNPVRDVLTLNIQKENIQILLADQSGKTIQRLSVQPGQHSINMQSLPTGIYQLAIFEGGVRIETKQIMKQ